MHSQEVLFPALLPKEPFVKSNRWYDYGDELFRLQDRKASDMLLAPTHEEMFALLVKDIIQSYKNLPTCLYQIQTKYRDEARPRAGLIRGREFSMMDAYSFDLDNKGLEISYNKQRQIYQKIFQKLNLDYVIVQAFSGAMGGSYSEEFLHPNSNGEDTFAIAPSGWAANTEAIKITKSPNNDILAKPKQIINTPNLSSIEQVCQYINQNNIETNKKPYKTKDFLKAIIIKLTPIIENYASKSLKQNQAQSEIIAVFIPGDRQLDIKRAEAFWPKFNIEIASDKDIKQAGLILGFIGPENSDIQSNERKSRPKTVKQYFDPRVSAGTIWVTGANKLHYHTLNMQAGRDFSPDNLADVANIASGDPTPDGSGSLKIQKGI
jgi:prolyl-tRNA synthetase